MESLNSRGLSSEEPTRASECQNVRGVFVLLNKELELMSTLWWHWASTQEENRELTVLFSSSNQAES